MVPVSMPRSGPRGVGVVAELSESAMSNRAIADVIGVSDQTVNNDMNAGDKSWHLIARSLARTAKPTRHRKRPDPASQDRPTRALAIKAAVRMVSFLSRALCQARQTSPPPLDTQ